MIVFAYSECGLSIEKFFKLSLFEWSLEVEKVKKANDRDFRIWESNAALTRKIVSAIYNSAGKSYKGFIDEKDLLPLSFDSGVKEKKETREMTPEEIEKKFGKHLKG